MARERPHPVGVQYVPGFGLGDDYQKSSCASSSSSELAGAYESESISVFVLVEEDEKIISLAVSVNQCAPASG